MPPETRTSSDTVINFLKSQEFVKIVKSIVKEETQHLYQRMEKLEDEVRTLRESIIDMVRLLTTRQSQQEVQSVNTGDKYNSNGPNQASHVLRACDKPDAIGTEQSSKKGKEDQQTEKTSKHKTTHLKQVNMHQEDTEEKSGNSQEENSGDKTEIETRGLFTVGLPRKIHLSGES